MLSCIKLCPVLYTILSHVQLRFFLITYVQILNLQYYSVMSSLCFRRPQNIMIHITMVFKVKSCCAYFTPLVLYKREEKKDARNLGHTQAEWYGNSSANNKVTIHNSITVEYFRSIPRHSPSLLELLFVLQGSHTCCAARTAPLIFSLIKNVRKWLDNLFIYQPVSLRNFFCGLVNQYKLCANYTFFQQ